MTTAFTLASARDEAQLLELMQEFYQVEHLPFDETIARRALQQLFGNPHFGLIYLISSDLSPAGYVVLTFGFSLEFHGRDAFVDELYLRPPYRGQGLGRAALLRMEEVCRREKIAALHLEVDHSNTRAQEVYRAAGFRDHSRYLLTKWFEEEEPGGGALPLS